MYDGSTYFAWFVLSLMCFIVVVMVVWLGSMPAKLARERNHPQADAISACSWWGLAFGGVGWVVALVWALMKAPHDDQVSVDGEAALATENAELRQEVASLKSKLIESSKPNKN